MRSERVTAAAVLLALAAAPVRAQDPLTAITPGTQVRAIEFRYTGTSTLDEATLREQIALTERGGLVGLRRLFGFLPFVSPVGEHPFDPLELQRDVIRIRNLYRESGFLRAEVHYDVRYDAESDLVDVAYVVSEGEPLRLGDLQYRSSDGVQPHVPAGAERRWARVVRNERKEAGRLGQVELQAIAARAGRWFRTHGYPFATAVAEATVDTAANRADVVVEITEGPRTRIRGFEVTGNETVPARHLTRQLPLRPGDWYDAEKLEEGRQQLIQLDIVRLALVDVPRETADDSAAVVRLEVTENLPNLVSGDAGFASDGGLTTQLEWTNRSFLGGVRTLTVAAVAQTGVLALEDPQRLYRLGATLFQPYVGHRRLSAAGGPFVEYRDDLRDRSRAVGVDGTLVWAAAPLRSVSLGYTFSHRRILEYGLGEDLEPEEYLPILGLADPGVTGTLDRTVDRGVVRLEASYGYLDEFANPRRGFVLRPRLEVSAPGVFNSSEYLLLDLGGTAFLPLTRRVGFALRGAAGRIWPFGGSLPRAGESPFLALLRLRDVTFTAGGTRDVRGWGSQLVGPKIPKVRRTEDDGGLSAERYTPLGGLARISGRAELRLPLPGFAEEWQTFGFLDGGRVWIPDERFALGRPDLEQDDVFAAVGGGIGYQTVVGAVQVALGYKLNPSALDVRRPEDVLDALVEGRPVTAPEIRSARRWHLHFAIGSTF